MESIVSKRIHLIAIGGAIMHNLAIALKNKGYIVSGSDDAIHDPAKGNLERAGLLPEIGWKEENIHTGLDIVILGMHARKDNIELLKARELGLPIVSFPEFVAQLSKDKKRVVIGGSHGKTTTTAMIMYALKKAEIDFDYLVGSSIDGFELSVHLSDAPIIIIEGDEYLSSPLDLKSKFLWYHPQLSILTGIAYDHINVFPTFDSYLDTFRTFISQHKEDSQLFWFKQDEHLANLLANKPFGTPYDTPEYSLNHGNINYVLEGKHYPLSIIGEHNLQNIEAAMLVCEKLGIRKSDFLHYMADFTGAGRRMEKKYDKDGQIVIRDFAHSPSKLEATTKAVKQSYPSKPLLAVFELHTFSSLNKTFLPYYKDSMIFADQSIVYVDSHVFEHRNMEVIDPNTIKESFGSVQVCMDKSELEQIVLDSFQRGENILLMSSGTFSKAEFPF